MKTALLVATCWMFCGAVVQGAERGFDDIIRAISDQLHARPMHIPFFGLVSFATSVAHPAGVKHLDLAVFEHVELGSHAARDIAETIRSANREWLPFVHVRKPTETVLVYLTEERNDCKLLVVAIETNEATVVELKLNPEAMQAWLREPEKSAVKQ